MTDSLDLKLDFASEFLAKIPNTIPKQHGQQIKLEKNTEAFLFFASGAIEILKRKINDRFEIFDSKNIFYIHGLRKNLAGSGIQKKVKDQIADYFSMPTYTKSKINTTKSSLWRLQSLRNQAMHGNIIRISSNSLIFTYTIHEGKKQFQFTQRAQNPQRYFGQIMHGLSQFTNQVLETLEAKSD